MPLDPVLTPVLLAALPQTLVTLLEPLSQGHNLTVTVRSSRYDPHLEQATLTLIIQRGVPRADQRSFAAQAQQVGLLAADYGHEFPCDGRVLKLVGVLPAVPRFPFRVLDLATNTEYRLSRDGRDAIIAARTAAGGQG